MPASDRPSEEEEEEQAHKTLGPGTPVVSSAGPNDLTQQTTEEAPEASHALPAKGHCHQDTASMDTCDGKYAMDMLNKSQKDDLHSEETFSTTVQSGRQPPDGHDCPGEYQDTFRSLNTQCLKEDVSSARHSSGCDDSGVFLEDIPYPTETINNNYNHPDAKTKVASSTVPHPAEKVREGNVSDSGKTTQSAMRQYSIEAPNGAESDEDKSDDLGLASSSVDSADDLDVDPLPLTITIPESETVAFPKSRPPPVPVRKSIINSHACRSPSVYQQTESAKELDVATPIRHSHNDNGNNTFRSDKNSISKTFEESLNSERKNNFQPQYHKWKSEECLRSHIENKWSFSGRQKEKTVSVKDRIAMFSEMETSSNTVKKEEHALPRFGNENSVKLARSTENLEKKVDTNRTNESSSSSLSSSALTRENKWHSMCNLPPPTSSSLSTEKISDNVKSHYNMSTLVPSSHESVTPDTHFSDAKSTSKEETDCHKYAEKPIVSSYPQTQLTNNKRYNYSVYNLKALKSPEENSRKSAGLLSIIDPRKQAPLPKLKGLVIPDRPSQSSTSKALPTIMSSDSVLLPIKSENTFLSDFTQNKDWKKSPFSASSSMSLPRSRSDRHSKIETGNEKDTSGTKCNALGDPPWKLNSPGGTLPKYSPAFKRRMLELPHGLGSSLSPTPPSSITSPLSPPPSSPSSICSSNASSSSIAAKQQNIFQFSLSHSKPVTPVLPEKPIMSPPSMPSDVEYEGDNSEDSSTSASPMLQAMDPSKHENSPGSNGFLSSAANSNTSPPRGTKESNSPNNYQSVWKQCPSTDSITSSAYSFCSNGVPQFHTPVSRSESAAMRTKPDFAANENSLLLESSNVRSAQPIRTTNKSVDDVGAKNNLHTNKESPVSDSCGTHNVNNNNYFAENDVVAIQNAANIFHSFPEGADEIEGSRNGFTEARQEVFVGKFRAQPMKLNDAVTESFHAGKVYSDHDLGLKYPEDRSSYSSSYGSLKNGCSVNNFTNHDDVTSSVPEKHQGNENHWSQADLISLKKRTQAESEDDDSHSSLSQRTEDSRHTTDDYLSDTTTDSLEKSIDPEFRPRKLSQQRTVLRASTDGTDSVQKFRALAEKWEQRAEPTDTKPPIPPPPVTVPTVRRESKLFSTVSSPSSATNTSVLNSPLKLPPSLMPRQHSLDVPTERKANATYSSNSGTIIKTTRETIPRVTRSTSLNEERFTAENTWTSEQIHFAEKGKVTSDNCNIERTWNNELSSPVKNYASAKDDKSGDRTTRRNDSTNVLKCSTLPSFKNNEKKDLFDSIWKEPSKCGLKEERCTSSYIKTSCDEKELLINGRPDRSLMCGRLSSVRDTIKDFSSSRNLSKSQMLHTSGKDALGYASSYLSRTKPKSVSVSDIRKAFETQVSLMVEDKPKLPPRRIASEDGVLSSKHTSSPAVNGDLPPPDHRRVSSFDSTVSEPDMTVNTSARYGSVGSLPSVTKDLYGSVTSLSSTTSLISPQDLQQLIDEANLSLEEAGSLSHEILVVVLHRETPGGSIGITLAGGADYEVKEITVHKVISGSLADRDGRIRKGDRVISINGRNLKGITHRDALEILKAPRPEVVLVISREKDECDQSKGGSSQDQSMREGIKNAENFRRKSDDSNSLYGDISAEVCDQILQVELVKHGTGLGFSIEGGKDSPLGDRPLVIKRIFKGGVADKEGNLDVGDEIISVNGQSVVSMTRTEAWNFLKKIPDGPVLVKARKSVFPES